MAHYYQERKVTTTCPDCRKRHEVAACTIGETDWNVCDECAFSQAAEECEMRGQRDLAQQYQQLAARGRRV